MRSGAEPEVAPAVVPFGDAAVLVTLGERIDPVLAGRVRVLCRALRAARAGGLEIGEPVAAHASVLVPFDPGALAPAEAGARVAAIVGAAATEPAPRETNEAGRLVEIPTRYGGPDGEDLPAVAELTGLTPDAVVEAHASTVYEVFMLGFAPGFAYLGVLPEALAVPRRASPRTRVPAGSVAIAERQTAVYPLETPGGWQLIGRTDLVLWNPSREPPALLAPGDRVRFVPVR